MKPKASLASRLFAVATLAVGGWCAQGQTEVGLGLQMYAGLTVTGAVGRTYEIQATTNVHDASSWIGIAAVTMPDTPRPYLYFDPVPPARPRRFYRAVDRGYGPTNMALIPSGRFLIGDALAEGSPSELPPHTVELGAFYMDKFEVTKAEWDKVYQWAVTNGYSFSSPGLSKAPNHPVQTVNWYDAVKWCNARSEMEGRLPAYYTSAAHTTVYRAGELELQNDWVKWDRGYRLPTEAEWEKAARGGQHTNRFSWGDTITHGQANYFSSGTEPYDLNYLAGYHPGHNTAPMPYTSPAGAFAANGYGLFDLAGNVWEWCWDWFGNYGGTAQTNPRGPAGGTYRVARGGGWYYNARDSRVAARSSALPIGSSYHLGFRAVLPAD